LEHNSASAELRHFPALTYLHITEGVLTPQELRQLQRERPSLKVEEEAYDPSQEVGQPGQGGGEHNKHEKHGSHGHRDEQFDPFLQRIMPDEHVVRPTWRDGNHDSGRYWMKNKDNDDDFNAHKGKQRLPTFAQPDDDDGKIILPFAPQVDDK
jgi:hypothetical protein